MEVARAVTGRWTRPMRPIFFASVSFFKRNAETRNAETKNADIKLSLNPAEQRANQIRII